MEEVRAICMPFVLTAIFFCLYGLWYSRRWQRKNLWHNQDDSQMRLSPQERAYRQNERRKMNNVFYAVMGCVMACMMLMLAALQISISGGFKLDGRWFYLLPFLGVLFLISSGIKRK
jgi:hypothetical protein